MIRIRRKMNENTPAKQEERLRLLFPLKLHKVSFEIISRGRTQKNKRSIMTVIKALGRPLKVNYKVMIKLADAIQHNATITEATRYAGVNRSTYCYYLNNNEVFAEMMATAKGNQNKLPTNFPTFW